MRKDPESDELDAEVPMVQNLAFTRLNNKLGEWETNGLATPKRNAQSHRWWQVIRNVIADFFNSAEEQQHSIGGRLVSEPSQKRAVSTLDPSKHHSTTEGVWVFKSLPLVIGTWSFI